MRERPRLTVLPQYKRWSTVEGVESILPLEQEHRGGWVSTFKDPDGNILQVLEFPGG